MSSLDPNHLPENIRKCMPAEIRQTLNTPTQAEASAKEEARAELKMHQQFEQWCRLQELPFIHSRTDRKSTIAIGTPDFVLLAHGKGCAIEFKGPEGTLTAHQAVTLAAWERMGVPCLVARSLKVAIDFAMGQLGL